jgi:drug/metabolite transporter superfamily protein YnfA
LPPAMDEAKVRAAVEALLTKHPHEAVAVYLHAFNEMNEVEWLGLKTMLDSDIHHTIPLDGSGPADFRSVVVSRHAQDGIAGDPATATEAWLVLHGYGMLARGMLHWFRSAERAGRVLIAGGQVEIVTMTMWTGWYCIGQTPLRPYDSRAVNPCLFRAGDRVRFRAIGAEDLDLLADAPATVFLSEDEAE